MNNNISIFNEEIKSSIILHIPHASTNVPVAYLDSYADFNAMVNEIKLVTDYDIDLIFDVPNIKKIKAEFSRVFCDVERLEDEKEELAKVGRGFYYTQSDNGEYFRNGKLKDFVYNNYYLKHHAKLEKAVEKRLNENDVAYIIDCHTFNDVPLNTDLDKSEKRADICLGVDEFHTPEFLVNYFKQSFKKHKYSVSINSPYSGTIVPQKFYNKEKRVNSIMIDINKRVYLNSRREDNVLKLNSIIRGMLNFD